MIRNRLKYGGRRKAGFGTAEAAILAAAGINAATQLTAAGINSSATKQAARDQAAAIQQQAQRQAQAIKDQTAKAKEYQQESQEFIREQNAENRALQQDIQMQLQMLTGQQNVNDRLEASKIQVRNGGNAKRKLRNALSTSLLRGSNLPFTITDGGGVIPLGQTPEGFDLYEIYGNDHEHYHKTRGGKNKTGVGVRFNNGEVIEGEGNQNTDNGEKMLVTPDNAYFISKHSIKGFNPSKAVDAGMNPAEAYTLQEQLKALYGISDDGKHNSSPVEKMMGGNFIYDLYNANGPQLGVDTIGDTAVGVAAGVRQLRNGGKCRRKAQNGYRTALDLSWANNIKGLPIPIPEIEPLKGNIVIKDVQPTRQTRGANTSSGLWNSAELWGAGISGVGNLGAAWITSAANRDAAKRLAGAYNTSADILADAYRNLQTIDMNSINREDYAAAHMMPALQAPVSFANSQNTIVNRALQRRLANAERYSLSGAAAQDRMAKAEVDAQDMRNRIYAADQEQMQKIRQANAERVTEAAKTNAMLDAEANKQFASAYLDMLQYNNDIENQKILGAAGALSEGNLNAIGALTNAQTSNAQAWANALLGSTQGFTNSINAMATRKADLAAALLGAGSDAQASYYARLAPRRDAVREYDSLMAQYNATSDPDTRRQLARRINNIASRRGLAFV